MNTFISISTPPPPLYVQQSVTSIAMTPDEKYIYSGSKDNSVIQWDAETGKKTYIRPKWIKNSDKIQSHSNEVLAVAVTSDNKYVVSAGRDSLIHIYDTRLKEEIKTLGGHRDAITSLSFKSASASDGVSSSASNYTLFSGSLDRCIKHWDLSEMGYIETLFGHQVRCWLNILVVYSVNCIYMYIYVYIWLYTVSNYVLFSVPIYQIIYIYNTTLTHIYIYIYIYRMV